MNSDETISSHEMTVVPLGSALGDRPSNNPDPEVSQLNQEFATQSQVAAKVESVLVESVTQTENNPYMSFRKRIVHALDYEFPIFHMDAAAHSLENITVFHRSGEELEVLPRTTHIILRADSSPHQKNGKQ